MLRISEISFPGLGIDNFFVDSEAFSIFGVSIAWYAVIITCGMICAIIYATLQAKKIGVTLDDITDFALWTIPIGIIGARLYYVLTSLERFETFEDVINIRNGGLAIYGGIIAGAATVFVVSKIKKIDFLALADCVAPGVLLAQGIGRWGNFMNGEAFGAETESFLRMGIQNIVSKYTFGTSEMVYVHPTFLYESIWCLLLFIALSWFNYHRRYAYGQTMALYFILYSVERFFVESLRTDSLMIGPFRQAQVISICAIIAGIILYRYASVNKRITPEDDQ
jgi:phosphatidylglycerol:prolipoprotein diacylglycerol transferase